jgi:hypothetical protein
VTTSIPSSLDSHCRRSEAEVAGTCRPELSDLYRIHQHCLELDQTAAGCNAVALVEEDIRFADQNPSRYDHPDLDLKLVSHVYWV